MRKLQEVRQVELSSLAKERPGIYLLVPEYPSHFEWGRFAFVFGGRELCFLAPFRQNQMSSLASLWGASGVREVTSQEWEERWAGAPVMILLRDFGYPVPMSVGLLEVLTAAAEDFTHRLLSRVSPAVSDTTPFLRWVVDSLEDEGPFRVFMACLVWMGQRHSAALPLFWEESYLWASARGTKRFRAQDGGGWLGTLVDFARPVLSQHLGLHAPVYASLAAGWCCDPSLWDLPGDMWYPGRRIVAFRFDILCHYPDVLQTFSLATRPPRVRAQEQD